MTATVAGAENRQNIELRWTENSGGYHRTYHIFTREGYKIYVGSGLNTLSNVEEFMKVYRKLTMGSECDILYSIDDEALQKVEFLNNFLANVLKSSDRYTKHYLHLKKGQNMLLWRDHYNRGESRQAIINHKIASALTLCTLNPSVESSLLDYPDDLCMSSAAEGRSSALRVTLEEEKKRVEELALFSEFDKQVEKRKEEEDMKDKEVYADDLQSGILMDAFGRQTIIQNVIEPDMCEEEVEVKPTLKERAAKALKSKTAKYAGATVIGASVLYGYKKALHPHVAPVVKALKDETIRQLKGAQEKAVAAISDKFELLEEDNHEKD